MRGRSTVSLVLQNAFLVLPWPLHRRLLNRLFGFQISSRARVGMTILIADRVSMADGAYVGHLTVIKNLSELKLHAEARIGNLNWISGMNDPDTPFYRDQPDRISMLEIEEHASISNRHLLDCTDKVRIGAFSTLAGFRSQVLSHSLDLRQSKQASNPVSVGAYCFVGTCCILLPGSALTDHCVLVAGSALRAPHTDEYCLLSGVPASKIREIEPDWKYFQRAEGFII